MQRSSVVAQLADKRQAKYIGQEMVRENENSWRSGRSRGILFRGRGKCKLLRKASESKIILNTADLGPFMTIFRQQRAKAAIILDKTNWIYSVREILLLSEKVREFLKRMHVFGTAMKLTGDQA